MEKFNTVISRPAPLDSSNVDTDQIIPKQFLKRIERTGFGEFLFFDWRFNDDGTIKPTSVNTTPDFKLNNIWIVFKSITSNEFLTMTSLILNFTSLLIFWEYLDFTSSRKEINFFILKTYKI